MTTVFVSGATGFIASHLVKQLLKANYKVIGSVRSQEKGQSLKSKLDNINVATDKFSFVVVEDIAAKGAFDQALKTNPEVDVFLHTASPVTFKVTDVKKELLDPAVEGTTNALNAIKEYGKNIKRVVVTSSIAAVGTFGVEVGPDVIFNEKSWNPITWEQALQNPQMGYSGSKTFAEKVVWDFVKKEIPQFTVATVCPGYVLGPQTFPIENKKELNTSAETINKLLKLKPNDKIPKGEGVYIDVRDVAKAHIKAFEEEKAQGQRLLLIAGKYNNQEIVNIIREDFDVLDQILPEGNPAAAKDFAPRLDKWHNEETRKILGFKFIDLRQSVDDAVGQILNDTVE
ncbi:uncharacterized protein LODBEIA_P25210 [Lodderomyces beijingensis]|uniref:NAD-dependent epimerase/dehydratase domain-containing protein n=1 Tax=Lodderomyces beijingensis TaxID=1775926 RepID=A0ABP0ZQ31_9ASCO